MDRTRTFYFIVFSLCINSLVSTPAMGVTDETPMILSNCKTVNVIPCIESMKIEIPSGQVLTTNLTGRVAGRDPEFTGIGYEEYSVGDLSFEGTSKNLLIPRIVYYPFGASKERDFLAIAVQPSWLDNYLDPSENFLEMPHRTTNFLCGDSGNRTKCRRSNNFNTELKFLFTLRVSPEFSPVWASGSTKDVEIGWVKPETLNLGYYQLPVTLGTLQREMVLFSDYYANPIEAIESSQYADYPADWPNLWINSNRDRSANPLNECRETPFLTVTTNAIYQDVPRWNAATESLDLKLWASHLKRDGSLNRGFYELRISEKLAKCFWGIDVSSSTRARVIISYPGSNEEAVVETVVTSFQKGVFQVQATNFTFSSPTLKTRILQQNPILDSSPNVPVNEAEKSPGAAVTKSGAKKLSINCVKGKITKKVTGVKPKCPTGYKKKA